MTNLAEDVDPQVESKESGKEITIVRRGLSYLSRHYMWPKKNELSPGKSYNIKLLITLFLNSFVVLIPVMHLFSGVSENLAVDTSNDIALIAAIFPLLLLNFIFSLKQKKIAAILVRFCDFHKFGKPEIFEEIISRLSLLTTAFYYLCILAVFVNMLLPLTQIPECEEYNRQHDLNEYCGLAGPPPYWFPKKIFNLSTKWVLYIYEVSAALNGMVPAATFGFLIFEINVHLVLHIKHLKRRLRELPKDNEHAKVALGVIVRYHQHIISLQEDLNSCTSGLLFHHLIFSSTTIGCITSQLLNLSWRSPTGPFLHLICWICNISISAIGGQIVIEESTSIVNTVYFCDWLLYNSSLRRDILFIMARSKKPLLVSTGPVGHMNVGIITKVLQGVYTILFTSFIRKAYGK